MKKEVFDSQTIATELCAILRTDSELQSFEIVPQPTFRNTSPVLHVDHNLGLESWCIKDLYSFVHEQLLLSTEIECQKNYLAVALLLNSNVKTYWNWRKKLVLNGNLDVDAELKFVAVILSLKPKAQDLYNHRKWLLSTLFQHENIPPECFFKELDIIQTAASKHVNNHTAWNFATWLLTHVESPTVLQEFWRISHEWISINISDFSGMHFHQRVLMKLIDASDKLDEDFKSKIASTSVKYLKNFFSYSEEVLKEDFIRVFFAIHLVSVDFELNDSLIDFYGNRESLWNHRRFLSYLLVKKIPRNVSEKNIELFFSSINKSISTTTMLSFLQMMNKNFFKNTANECNGLIERYDYWMKHLEIYPTDN